MDTYMALVQKVGTSMGQIRLYTDMDENMGLYNLNQFVMTDFKGDPIPRVTNVVLPAIATFADRVINISGGILPLIKVRSKLMLPEEKDKLKYFLYGAFDNANNSRAKRGLPSFNTKLAEYGALKRVIALRVIVKGDGAKTHFDLMPLDPRNMVYRMGIDGPIFVAHRTVRDVESIWNEYGIAVKGEEATIWEYWDKDVYRVYWSPDVTAQAFDANLILSRPNTLGYIPIVIVPLERTIYHNCKQIYLQMCRTASILKSQSMATLFGPQEFHTNRQDDTVPTEMPAIGDVIITGTDPNEGFKLIELNDVYQATAFMWQIETSEFQRASYAFIEYGGLEFPLSSLAISQLKEGRDQILFPLLQAITQCYREASDMMIRQFKAGKYKATLGDDEYIDFYIGADLAEPGVDCNIKFSFKATNVSEEGAAYQMAMAAEPFLPLRMRLEEIIKVDNAEAVMDELLIEQAEKSFPELAMPKMIRALANAGRLEEAAILKQILEQPQQQPQGPPQPVEQEQRVMPPPAQNAMPDMATAPIAAPKSGVPG